MTNSDIAYLRLRNQHISHPVFEKPEDEVRWLGAVQAQDYPAAKWGVGLRLLNADDALLEQAFNDGAILRTHVMRPTWHFVVPEDIRWMLALTAPRINAFNASYYRRYELDAPLFKRSNALLAKALRDGNYRTREELRGMLAKGGIQTGDLLRSTLIMMRAELDGIICSGPRRGKQFTYALLEERAPAAVALPHDEALAMLAERFFTSHGPATAHDMAKWSGLTVGDATKGIEAVGSRLEQETVENHTYWFAPTEPAARPASPMIRLLPNYDEYTVGYRHHEPIFDTANLSGLVYAHAVIIDGRVSGTWKRTLKRNEVIIESNFFAPLKKSEQRGMTAAAEEFGKFLGLPVTLI